MAAPTNPRFITLSDGPGYLERTPTCTGPLSGPFRVRIEAWQRWGGVSQSFSDDLVRNKSTMFWYRNETMMMEHTRTVRRSGDAHEDARERKRAETTPSRNEAQLNCVSLRPELDCEVTCGAVKGQDERPLRGALDSPASHHRTSMLTSENKLIKEGRHVGLDFYDLLIEALKIQVRLRPLSQGIWQE